MPEATWRCPACDTYNGAALRQCDICATTRPAAAPGPAVKSAPKSVPKPSAGAGAKSGSAPGRKGAAGKAAGTAGRAGKPGTAGAGKKAAARKGTGTKASPAKRTPAAGPGRTAEPPLELRAALLKLLADGADSPADARVSRELAALMPELFHADGRLRSDAATWDTLFLPDDIVVPPVVPRARPAARTPSVHTAAGAPRRDTRKPAPPRPDAPEVPVKDQVIACGCLLILVGAIVTGIVALVLNWDDVYSFVRHAGHHAHAAKPAPPATVAPGTPCPPALATLIGTADRAHARLLAAYRRADGKEEYAFCGGTSGKDYYFGRTTDKAFAGTPAPAKRTADGFEVDYSTTSFRFHGDTVTAYTKGKKAWDGKLTAESSLATAPPG